MIADDASFPASLDGWTVADWQEYRERVEDGEGSGSAIDAINRRRRRGTRRPPGEAVEAAR